MKSRSMIFGRNLKTLRESKGLSQEQAAKMVGCHGFSSPLTLLVFLIANAIPPVIGWT